MKDFPTYDFSAGAMLLIDKPYQWTSFDVVNKIRNALKPLKLKVGHAGTLDPLATGLLIICTGKLTKQIDTFQAEDKEYTGTMVLGASTPSYDLETEIDHNFDFSAISEEAIKNNCQHFLGEIFQYPPAHSAIKQDGERLYEKARRGEEVALRKRLVQINSFEITRIAFPEIDFKVSCTKGTYIRSLVHDFGKKLNNGAYLSKLTRTKSGEYHLNNAFNLNEFVDHLYQLKRDPLTPKD